MSLTKVHGAELIEIERRSQLVGELSDTGRHMAMTMGTYAILQQSVSASAGVVVLIVGGWSAARGDMTVGELLGFYAIAVLLLRQVSTIVTNVPVVLAGYESVIRLSELLESGTGEPYTGTRPIDFDGSVAFDGVSFAYERDPVLCDIDLVIAAGEQVAILGPNGAGKSTLVSLLLGSTGRRPVGYWPAAYRSTSSTCAACGVAWGSRFRTRSCFPERWRRTSPTAGPTPPFRRSGGPPDWRRPPSSSMRCRADTRLRSATTGSCCRPGSASASPSPALSWRAPRSWSSTSPRHTSTMLRSAG